MAWRDWIGYPDMLQDDTIEEMLKALQILTTNVSTIADAVVDLQQRVKRLENRDGV